MTKKIISAEHDTAAPDPSTPASGGDLSTPTTPTRRGLLLGGTAATALLAVAAVFHGDTQSASAATLAAAPHAPGGLADPSARTVQDDVDDDAIAAAIGGKGAHLSSLLAQHSATHSESSAVSAHLQRSAANYLSYRDEMAANISANVSPDGAPAAALDAAALAVTPTSGFMQSVDALGTTDNARFTALNAMAKAQATAGGPRMGFMFSARQYTTSVPIELWSGLYLTGARWPAREFSTSSCITYVGAAGTSTFKFVVNHQGYPSDGSPRDITIRGLQFDGGASTSVFPIVDPALGNNYRGQTLWSTLIDSCGFKNQRAVLWGYGDGLAIDGINHFQSIADVAIKLGGSECSIFAANAQSVGGNAIDNKKPFVQLLVSKSSIGMIMTTMRRSSYSMEILSGFDLTVVGWRADNQDNDPGYGAGLVVRGGDGIYFRGFGIKGYGVKPASGLGGAAANMGMIMVLGGTGIDFGHVSVQFDTAGKTSAPPTFPLLFIGPNVKAGQVSVANARSTRTGGVAPVLLQSRAGQIVGASIGATVKTVS